MRQLDSIYRGDREVVLAATKLHICQLQHALPELTYDSEFMLAAMCLNPIARCYAAQELWFRRDFVQGAVQLNGLFLEYAESFKEDFEVVCAAVSNNGYALRYAGNQARASRELVLAAVRQKGCALYHACEMLKCDREVVMTAVQSDKMAVVHARGGLRKDPDVLNLLAVVQVQMPSRSCSGDLAPSEALEAVAEYPLAAA